MNSHNKAVLMLLGTLAAVSLVTVLAKNTLKSVDFLSFVWLQMAFASSFMLIIGLTNKQLGIKNIDLKVMSIIFAIGILNFAIVRGIFIYALDLLPATTHAYVINFVGIVTMFLSTLILREPPNLIQILGAVLALIGVRLYFWELPDGAELRALLWLMGAVICLALTNILMRYLHTINRNKISNHQISTLSILFGSIPLILLGIASGNDIEEIKAYDWLIIALNAIVAICIGMIVFNHVLKTLKAFEASILASSGVIFTGIFSALLLEEVISANEATGIVIMIAGIFIVQKFSKSSGWKKSPAK
ncbi:DMT family transporter [Aliikangiella sp. G2MR2-5]|uniref:DMT family transporter n=1 Tax=Aliikangiella sp. G2MR2-5 TaxID=2788943 RepID=UPI0018A8D334|nr:DMT family transporter [Aliikangiella sp. G2MR2-5]